MTKDYKHRAASARAGKAQHSGPFWFFAGLLAGAFAIGLAWIKFDPGLLRSGSGLARTGVPRPTPETAKRPSAPPSLEFEFPDMLRKMEVMVPEEDPEPQARPVLPPPALPAPASLAQSPAQAVPPARPQPSAATPPAQRPQPAVPQVAARPAAAPEVERESFVLQLGAFKETRDLEQLRARLALLGIETRVQKVTINNNETFHRLRAGPYRSQQELDTVRRLLTRNNIRSVIIKWKG